MLEVKLKAENAALGYTDVVAQDIGMAAALVDIGYNLVKQFDFRLVLNEGRAYLLLSDLEDFQSDLDHACNNDTSCATVLDVTIDNDASVNVLAFKVIQECMLAMKLVGLEESEDFWVGAIVLAEEFLKVSKFIDIEIENGVLYVPLLKTKTSDFVAADSLKMIFEEHAELSETVSRMCSDFATASAKLLCSCGTVKASISDGKLEFQGADFDEENSAFMTEESLSKSLSNASHSAARAYEEAGFKEDDISKFVREIGRRCDAIGIEFEYGAA